MISISSKGNFNNTEKFLKKNMNSNFTSIFDKYGKSGVELLSSATPIDSKKTATSWKYEIKKNKKGTSIVWSNSNVVDGVPIAIIIQYGHATGTGGYVQGRDYINPAMRPLFDKITNNIWTEVNKT